MKKLATLLSLCLLLASCSMQQSGGDMPLPEQEEPTQSENGPPPDDAQPLTPDSLEKLLELTNARRTAIVKPTPDTAQVEDWNARELAPSLDFSKVEFTFDVDISETDVYTLEQALEDLDYLFAFYETGYGPYFYFGGNEAFDAAKLAVQNDLAGMDQITAPDIQESLVRHLSFVRDIHFSINNDNAIPIYTGYLSSHTFLKDTAGFTDSLSGRHLTAVDGGQDFSSSMVLSLTPDGDIAYRYMVLAEDQPAPSTLTFADGAEETTAMFSASEAAGRPAESDEIVSLSHVEEIPVITIKQMGFPHAKDDWESNQFLHLAEQMKDEPVLIIDLRYNGGGNSLLGQTFYETLTGGYLTPNQYSLTRMVFGTEEPEPDPEVFYYVPADVKQHYTRPELINDAWKLENPEPREVLERDQLLIVLTSTNTASSADNFTDLTFNLENSLVIGSNTLGMIISTASTGIRMPNTGTVGIIGFNLAVYSPDHFQEGVGFMPDLWVSGDALQSAVALAKSYLNS